MHDKPLSKREAEEQAGRAQQIVAMTSLFFAGQEPGVIGSCLADLMAMFLCNHKIPTDPMKEHDVRTKLLAQWIDTVWDLVAVNEGRGGTKQ